MVKPAADDRREALCAWLRANGINPNDVPTDSDLAITTEPDGQHIHYESFDRDINGMILASWSGEGPARSKRTVPLKTPPPVWWEPRVKPTRDQLLAVLERVRALAPDLELEATLPGMHDAAREAKRDASRRIRGLIDSGVPSWGQQSET